jgi:predicted RNA binding protein YcfA (HicA-like mRNA interferase family)
MTNSRDVIKTLEANGWKLAAVRGSHHQFIHPSKPGRVTVPHPKKDLTTGTIRSIYRQAGIDWTGRGR